MPQLYLFLDAQHERAFVQEMADFVDTKPRSDAPLEERVRWELTQAAKMFGWAPDMIEAQVQIHIAKIEQMEREKTES